MPGGYEGVVSSSLPLRRNNFRRRSLRVFVPLPKSAVFACSRKTPVNELLLRSLTDSLGSAAITRVPTAAVLVRQWFRFENDGDDFIAKRESRYVTGEQIGNAPHYTAAEKRRRFRRRFFKRRSIANIVAWVSATRSAELMDGADDSTAE